MAAPFLAKGGDSVRKLMWFTIGFAVSCGIGAYGMLSDRFILLAVCACLLVSGGVLAAFRRGKGSAAVAVLAGCVAGGIWLAVFVHNSLDPLSLLNDTEGTYAITASDYSRETDYGVTADGVVTIGKKQYPIRAYLKEGITLKPGDVVTSDFRVRLTLPDSDEGSTYYPGKGIFLILSQKGDAIIAEAGEIPLRFYPAVLRRNVQNTLAALFPEEVSAFAKALLLGDTSELSYALDTAFQVSGIRHIVAVSGLHISILYSLIALLTFRQRHLTMLLGIPVLLLFAAVAGFTPSVTRACIMVWLMLLSRVFNREYDPPTALSFAVLVMLLYNPWVITSVSLQLSVGCVAGILLFSGRISGWMTQKLPKRKGFASKIQKSFCTSVSVTLSATSLVTPLSAWYFGAVSLVSVVTNLLALWVVNLIFNGLVLVVLLYGFLPAAASALAWLLTWPVRYVFLVSRWLAEIPVAAVYTTSVFITVWLVFLYVLLAVFLFQREKTPGILACCGCIGLCIALLASWGEPAMDDVRITMLDVGQGQSILLQSEGRTYLVDCGGDSDTETADLIAETLLSQGTDHLDGIILTHYDRDHAGGLENLLTRIDTEVLLLPDVKTAQKAPESDGQILYVREDVTISFGNTEIRVFGPTYPEDDNENSLCVLFDTEKCDILITGDRSGFGEQTLLRYARVPDVDILVAGHHGAASSTSEELLRAVTPEIVLISVGEDNVYGHPASSLLQRLEEFGCQIYRTDKNGTITIRR